MPKNAAEKSDQEISSYLEHAENLMKGPDGQPRGLPPHMQEEYNVHVREQSSRGRRMTDISVPLAGVDIVVDDEGETLWVNVDARCVLRVSNIHVPFTFEHQMHLEPIELHLEHRDHPISLPEKEIPLGLYKHYKNVVYEVFGVGLNSEYGYWSVYYRNVETGQCFDRQISHFLSSATLSGGKEVERFMYIGESDPEVSKMDEPPGPEQILKIQDLIDGYPPNTFKLPKEPEKEPEEEEEEEEEEGKEPEKGRQQPAVPPKEVKGKVETKEAPKKI